MARDTRQLFLAQLDRATRETQRAFTRAIEDIRSSTQIAALTEAIESGSVSAALDILQLGPEYFDPLEEAVRNTYLAGGRYQAATLPALRSPDGVTKLVVRFGGTNPRAVKWISEFSSELIVGITTQQVDAVRLVIERGLAMGRHPNSIALDIVGRMNPYGRRKGGILGLTKKQAEYVTNMREDLSSWETAGKYKSRTRRDKRFDSIVNRSVAEKRNLTKKQIEKITTRYESRLQQLRGETIARSESIEAFGAGRHEGLEQMVEKGHVLDENIIRTWHDTGDGLVRDTHGDMDGQVVRGRNTPFKFPGGSEALYPGDTQFGAPAAETINCRCWEEVTIDLAAEAQRRG